MRGQAAVIAAIMWTLFVVDVTSPSPFGRVSGLIVGTDFVQFYTVASAARSGRLADVASAAGLRVEQLRLVPESEAGFFPPVYPPQVALALQPLGALRYRQAYVAWTIVTLLLYAFAVRLLLGASPRLQPFAGVVGWIAAASPAAWFLVLHGQLSMLALVSLALTCVALGRKRPWLAGAALGLLAFKPSLFLPAVIVCALAAEWQMVLGAALAASGQFAVTLFVVDLDVVRSYFSTMIALAQTPDVVASNLPLMQSWRTFWSRLLPAPVATGCYALTAVAVVWVAALGWRRLSDPLHRVGLLAVAVVLVSPHLFVYDLVILAPFVLASADLVLKSSQPTERLCRLTYLGYFAPLWGIPVAMLGLQASTLVYTAWLLAFIAVARTERAGDFLG